MSCQEILVFQKSKYKAHLVKIGNGVFYDIKIFSLKSSQIFFGVFYAIFYANLAFHINKKVNWEENSIKIISIRWTFKISVFLLKNRHIAFSNNIIFCQTKKHIKIKSNLYFIRQTNFIKK